MSLESADPHDSNVRREKSNPWKIREKELFVVHDERLNGPKRVDFRNCWEYTLSTPKTDLFVGPHQHKRTNPHWQLECYTHAGGLFVDDSMTNG